MKMTVQMLSIIGAVVAVAVGSITMDPFRGVIVFVCTVQ